MASSFKSNFQRSQSKVWWGNSPPERQYFDYSSIETNYRFGLPTTTLEVAQPIWNNRRGSPGSLKSQDSGFSDHDTSPTVSMNATPPDQAEQLNNSPNKNMLANSSHSEKLTPNKNVNRQINELVSSRSPTTPPTVIKKYPQSDVFCSSRRISFSASPPPDYDDSEASVLEQIDRLNFDTTSPLGSNENIHSTDEEDLPPKLTKDRSIRRGRNVQKSPKSGRHFLGCVRPLTDSVANIPEAVANEPIYESISSMHSISEQQETVVQIPGPQTPKGILKSTTPYNNETVVFGYADDERNNTSNYDMETKALPTYLELFPASTSTPKMGRPVEVRPKSINKAAATKLFDSLEETFDSEMSAKWQTYTYTDYVDPALNGHSSSVQFWMDEIRGSFCHEVLSTLQAKSVAQEATRNLRLTSATAGKTVRQLQIRAVELQLIFERTEKFILNERDDEIEEAIKGLVSNAREFIDNVQLKNIFRADCDQDQKKFDDNVDSIFDMCKDLRMGGMKLYEDEPEMLLDEIYVLKSYILVTLRLVYEKLIKVIVDSIDEAKCELILRSNLNTLSMISNIDYNGFAALNEAFLSTEIIRILLIICIEQRYSSIRALALRALATICSSLEAIRQFETVGGVEILKDIMVEKHSGVKRLEPELREAVSVLTQITAPWHGIGHRVAGLKECLEPLVEFLTELAEQTTCCQTLLLCVACLNNLSKIETTSIYSLMSNSTVLKLKEACDKRGPGASIFLYEQITGMLYNMGANNKCQSHLANKHIIKFMVSIFQTHFYEKYNSRAERDALKRTIKAILHIFTRLLHESVVCTDILESNVIPLFIKVDLDSTESSEHSREISFIKQKLNETGILNRSANLSTRSAGSSPQFNRLAPVDKNRQESYV